MYVSRNSKTLLETNTASVYYEITSLLVPVWEALPSDEAIWNSKTDGWWMQSVHAPSNAIRRIISPNSSITASFICQTDQQFRHWSAGINKKKSCLDFMTDRCLINAVECQQHQHARVLELDFESSTLIEWVSPRCVLHKNRTGSTYGTLPPVGTKINNARYVGLNSRHISCLRNIGESLYFRWRILHCNTVFHRNMSPMVIQVISERERI